MTWSQACLLAALLWAVGGLATVWLRGRRWPAPSAFAETRGSAAAAIRYELSTAFLPWAKESARMHLPTYLAGVVLHLAVFATLLLAVSTLVPGSGAALPTLRPAFLVLLPLGLIAGLSLLAKRISLGRMRGLSVPEDYLANLLANVVVAAGILVLFRPDWLAALHLTAAALCLYLPVGKLRHVIFLFLARLHLGRMLGRRGVLPPVAGAR